MKRLTRDLVILASATLIITLLVWLPHLLALKNFWGLNFSEGFNTIFRNFDGMEYVIIAKTFYRREILAALPQSLPAEYFASHFPGFSILILAFSPLLGFLKSMLFVTLISTILACWVFYFLVRDFKLTNQPFFLSILFLILPARWIIVHSVGSSEPLFIFLIIAAVYFFMKFENDLKFSSILSAGIFGFLAQLTRPPAILLFIGLSFYLLWKLIAKKTSVSILRIITTTIPLFLIPAGLILIFYWYSQSLGDFWAYFHSGDNIHLTFPPFQVFNREQFWVGDIWLEEIVYIFLLGFLAVGYLFKKGLYPMAAVALTYLLASTLIAHRDISRYILPITPFILIAFEKVLTSKEFKIMLPIIALIIYLYAQNFILANTAPYPNPQLFN